MIRVWWLSVLDCLDSIMALFPATCVTLANYLTSLCLAALVGEVGL